nr:uncharacterized protein LOC129417790 [Misgurnus anguillicaudatus]
MFAGSRLAIRGRGSRPAYESGYELYDALVCGPEVYAWRRPTGTAGSRQTQASLRGIRTGATRLERSTPVSPVLETIPGASLGPALSASRRRRKRTKRASEPAQPETRYPPAQPETSLTGQCMKIQKTFQETIEDSFSDDSDDEDYMPPLCIRNSGAVTTGIRLEDLEAIGMEETVHVCPDNEPPEQTTLFEKVPIVEEGDIVGEPAALTYFICLKSLAEYLLLPIPLCTAKDLLTSVECRAPGPFRIDCKVRGTSVILQWVSHTRR